MLEPIKQTSNILIFIKYDYLSRYGEPGEELDDIKTNENTTLKQIKDELNKSFIFGELDPDQYEIYNRRGTRRQKKDKQSARHILLYLFRSPIIRRRRQNIKGIRCKGRAIITPKSKMKNIVIRPVL